MSVMNVKKLHILSVTCPPTCMMVLETTESFSMSVKSLMTLYTTLTLKEILLLFQII